MTTPPSHWPDKAMSLAVTVLAVAVMLYIAARLIEAVLPVPDRSGRRRPAWFRWLVFLSFSTVEVVNNSPDNRGVGSVL